MRRNRPPKPPRGSPDRSPDDARGAGRDPWRPGGEPAHRPDPDHRPEPDAPARRAPERDDDPRGYRPADRDRREQAWHDDPRRYGPADPAGRDRRERAWDDDPRGYGPADLGRRERTRHADPRGHDAGGRPDLGRRRDGYADRDDPDGPTRPAGRDDLARRRDDDRTRPADDRTVGYGRGWDGPGDPDGPTRVDGPDGWPAGPPGQRVPRKLTVTRVAAARTRYLVGQGTRRISAASRADGAGESGLTPLIWTHCAHYAADAMIAVCLAGTIFFSAARSEQRLQVALYLLVTMAPFALVAPFIGPALDRLRRGRRMALAATALGRAVLVWIMAAQFDNGLALYPAAFGALVLSKAYAVLRGACLPRVLPAGMSLVSANARLSMFGLGAAAVGGVLPGGLINVTDSYPLALRVTAAVCLVAVVLSLRLPATVDSAEGEVPVPATVVDESAGGRGTGPHVVTALRAAGTLRGLSGFLTLFLAFWIQSTETGTAAALALGGLVAAAAGGAVAGTALGARMPMRHPDPVLLGSIGAVAAISVVAALSYGLGTALLVVGVAGVANALGKLCLDAIIQREVPEEQRASAFARSETLLQLAWVLGGGLGIALPSNGTVGFAVAAAVLVLAFTVTLKGRRGPLRRPRAA